MRFPRPAGRLAAALALPALLASGAQASPASSPKRPAVEALARHLEAAIARVSPSAQVLTGSPDTTQALHVSGIGVVVVLPSRALPQRRRQLNVRARAREQEPAAVATPAPPRPGPGPVAPAPRALEQLEREFQREMAMRTELLRAMERVPAGDDAILQRMLELQMLAIREQAESFRIEVERARLRTEREVRVRLGSRGQVQAPAPQPVAEERPAEAPAPAGPAEPPWRLWMAAPADVAQVNQAMVEQVRDAVTSTLEAQGGELGALDPKESVTVAVDFVGAGPFALRPRVRATLVVRASVADVQARAAGRLASEEFRQRVQARQY